MNQPSSTTFDNISKRLSPQRWAHSPVWSDSGHSVAYVATDATGSAIVHVDLATAQQTLLGLPGAVNCEPRFDADDRTLLFSAAASPDGPFRIYCQAVGQSQPQPLTPEGPDCMLPVRTNEARKVLCAQLESDHLTWVWADLSATQSTDAPWGASGRLETLQAWAGVPSPLSPDGSAILFYDSVRDRMSVLHINDKILRQHRPATISACWIDPHTAVLATPTAVFLTDIATGQSTQILSGTWIPARFSAVDQRLILFGRDSHRTFSIWEISTQRRPA